LFSFSSRYGGIYERGSREYTLDDFYALQLDKMEKYLCLKESDVVIPDGDVESSSDDDDDDSDDEGEDDEEEGEERDGDGGDDTDVDVEHDEADEEDVTENAAKTTREEEDQSTEKAQLVVDEQSKLSQANLHLMTHQTRTQNVDFFFLSLSLQDELRSQATTFMGVSKDTTRSPEDIQSTPLPGETLAMFYARSR